MAPRSLSVALEGRHREARRAIARRRLASCRRMESISPVRRRPVMGAPSRCRTPCPASADAMSVQVAPSPLSRSISAKCVRTIAIAPLAHTFCRACEAQRGDVAAKAFEVYRHGACQRACPTGTTASTRGRIRWSVWATVLRRRRGWRVSSERLGNTNSSSTGMVTRASWLISGAGWGALLVVDDPCPAVGRLKLSVRAV